MAWFSTWANNRIANFCILAHYTHSPTNSTFSSINFDFWFGHMMSLHTRLALYSFHLMLSNRWILCFVGCFMGMRCASDYLLDDAFRWPRERKKNSSYWILRGLNHMETIFFISWLYVCRVPISHNFPFECTFNAMLFFYFTFNT